MRPLVLVEPEAAPRPALVDPDATRGVYDLRIFYFPIGFPLPTFGVQW